MIKILHVVSFLGSGGVEALLYNYYKNFDKEKIKFDFIVHGDEEGIFEEKFKKMGSHIYHVTPRSKNPLKNIMEFKKIIKDSKYDIIHSHLEHMSFIPLYFAKKNSINTRISHAHLSNQNYKSATKYTFIKLLKKISKRYTTHFFGCSQDAIVELFGEKTALSNSKIVKNAIDIDYFTYNLKIREAVRKELNLENNFVVGHIGRFTDQKNHFFLIEIFKELLKINKNAKLLLIGEGPLEESIKSKVEDYGIQNQVIFLGVGKDINKFMNAFDVFVFPSNYEGLGIVLIEAQACALQSFTSEKVVPKEAKVSSYLKYLSLSEDSSFWANSINDYAEGYIRRDNKNELRNAGYDIEQQAKILQKFYMERSKINDGI